jgi:hypothetical protein
MMAVLWRLHDGMAHQLTRSTRQAGSALLHPCLTDGQDERGMLWLKVKLLRFPWCG